MEPILLPIWPDAAQALGISRTTIFRLVRERRLASVRIGRKRLIPASAVTRFAAQLEAEQLDAKASA